MYLPALIVPPLFLTISHSVVWSTGAVYSTVTLILPDWSIPLECTMWSTGWISMGGSVGAGVVVVGGGGGGGAAVVVVGVGYVVGWVGTWYRNAAFI